MTQPTEFEVKINPLGHSPLLMPMIIILVICVATSLSADGPLLIISLVVGAIMLLGIAGTLSRRLGKKWARVHYPFLVKYAHEIGHLRGTYPGVNLDDQVEAALRAVLGKISPRATESQLFQFWATQTVTRENAFLDQSDMQASLQKFAPHLTPAQRSRDGHR